MRMKIDRKKWAVIGMLAICVVVLSGALGFLYTQHDEKEKLIDNERNNPKIIVQGINNEGVNQENGKTGVSASDPGITDEATTSEPPTGKPDLTPPAEHPKTTPPADKPKTTPPADKPVVTPPVDKPKVTTPLKPHAGKPPVSKDKKKGVPDKDNPFLNNGGSNNTVIIDGSKLGDGQWGTGDKF